MKTSRDPRHLKRVKAVQELFAWEFNQQNQGLGDLAKKVTGKLDIVDRLIAKAAPDRPISQINKIDLAILRLAAYELVVDKQVPYKVIVDEAVELAKHFGSDSSPSLVNGALGCLIEMEKIER